MGAAAFAECDVCGKVTPSDNIYGLAPRDWWTVNEPTTKVLRRFRDEAQTLGVERAWLCSLDCMVDWSIAQLNAEQGARDWGLVPMRMPSSPVVHAMPLGVFRDHSDGLTRSICHAVSLKHLEVAVGDNLRVCKRCVSFADRVEPGWFIPAEVTAPT